MRKWPVAIVLIILAIGLLVLCLLMFPMYYIKTEGTLDMDGDGSVNSPEDKSFTVEEYYYLDHYEAESNLEMFDTDGDGTLDSQKSPEYQ